MLLTQSAAFFPNFIAQIYILKTVLVTILLVIWRRQYRDDLLISLSFKEITVALLFGLVVFFIWVVPEEFFFQMKKENIFNPYNLTNSTAAAISLMIVRVFGAVITVPIMEELFWRSFLLRYLINPKFKSVSLGSFTWFSFFSVAILFGLEHHRFIVGIVAGLLYGLLMIYHKNLRSVIIAHFFTNLCLALYVVYTKKWEFW